jgi:hypothetical protein
MGKTIILKDQKELLETTKKLIDQMRFNPQSMPICILCGMKRSTTLLAYCPEGEERTALFGVCDACKPESDEELADKVIEIIKKKIETQENTIHLTQKEFIN